jgi:hypothetical protein
VRLEGLLADLASVYTSQAAHAAEHHAALRRADARAIQKAVEAQSHGAAALARLEQRRRELVAAAVARHPGLLKKSGGVTLTDIARLTEEPHRERLLAMAAELKRLVTGVHEITGTIKSATLSLLAHMEGLMRQVGRQLSHAGTYSRRGFVESNTTVLSGLDLST